MRGLGARGARRFLPDLLLLPGVGPEENEHFSNLLHRLGAHLLANGLHPRAARIAIIRSGAHLDELVRRERAIDLGDHGVGETLVADDDDRGELVRCGAQFAAA